MQNSKKKKNNNPSKGLSVAEPKRRFMVFMRLFTPLNVNFLQKKKKKQTVCDKYFLVEYYNFKTIYILDIGSRVPIKICSDKSKLGI